MIRRLGFGLAAVALILLAMPLLAMAQGAPAAAAVADGAGLRAGLIALAANIGIGIAALGGGLGQGRMVASAMESIGRNPSSTGQIFTPMIIGLAFIEALTLYSLVIAFILQAKI
jgi:F-type H+-transporting ATPase subunit c